MRIIFKLMIKIVVVVVFFLFKLKYSILKTFLVKVVHFMDQELQNCWQKVCVCKRCKTFNLKTLPNQREKRVCSVSTKFHFQNCLVPTTS